MFQHFESYAGDPIFGLVEIYNRDQRAEKINLTIGIYLDESGQLPLMAAIANAENICIAEKQPKPYLPMSGLPAYCSAVQSLLFGADHAVLSDKRVATIQTVGGSGALKIGADVLKQHFPTAAVWVSDPTWDNHRGIFEGSGFEVNTYPYLASGSDDLAFDAMLAVLDRLPYSSVVLLHACCHNPTGVDLSQEQWLRLIKLLAERQLIPFIDIAYQGFGEGIEQDAFCIREMVKAGLQFFVASSFSKNFSIYGERCGALSVVCKDMHEAKLVLGQLQLAVRRAYSNPPAHGANLVARVLTNPTLCENWQHELNQMRRRIEEMRRQLRSALVQLLPAHDFSRFTSQRGMFTFTGLTLGQVNQLRDEYAIYLLGNGRMCMAGLNHNNVQTVAKALAAVI